MATKYQLSWRDGERRWRKRYGGKDYYFRLEDGETKASSYARCMKEWREKKRELDQTPASEDEQSWATLIDRAKSELLLLQEQDDRQRWMIMYGLMNSYQHAKDLGLPYLYDEPAADIQFPWLGFAGPEEEEPAPWERYRVGETKVKASGLSDHIEAFLEEKKREVSVGRVDTLRRSLNDFLDFVGAVETADLKGDHISDYRLDLLRRVDDEDVQFSDYTARDYLAAVEQFFSWAWVREYVADKPRCFEDDKFKIPIKTRKQVHFTDEEIKSLLADAPEQLRLYVLLMLNIGATQKDISDLKQEQVDWQAGTITRKRSKTQDHDGVPEVTYQLWKPTWDLLQKYRSKDAELALTNRNGQALLRVEERKGKLTKSDNIKSAYFRFLKGREVNKPLKALRATASNKLNSHDVYGRYVQHFLGHSARTVADKHYVTPSQDQFDKAVAWLGQQFLGEEA